MVGAPSNSSTSPSLRAISACEQTSSMANSSPSKSTTAMSTSGSSTRSAPSSGTSDRAQTRSKLTRAPRWRSSTSRARLLCPCVSSQARSRGHLDGLLLQVRQRTEAGLDGGHQPVLQLRDADVLDDVGEEAADDQPTRGLGVDAAGAEVEQLLVVEAAGGAGVAGADDLAGLDLQVRHRVGAGAVGEHQVAVELVGVGAGRGGPDPDVADPHGARVLALQRALV